MRYEVLAVLVLLSAMVSAQVGDVCGDGVCGSTESPSICSADCMISPSSGVSPDTWTNLVQGASNIYVGVKQLGAGLITAGTSLLRLIYPNMPHWITSILELGLAVFALYYTLRISQTIVKYAAIFLVLLTIISVLLGTFHLGGAV